MRKQTAVSVKLAILFAAIALMVSGAAPVLAKESTAEGSFDRTLKVNGAVDLSVKTGSGYIKIHRGDSTTVQVHAKIRASEGWFGGGSPEEKVKAIEKNPPVEQTGNVIRIGRVDDRWLRENVSISYEITVPAETKLDAHTGSGSAEIEGIKGPVEAETGSGEITLRDIGGELRASTGSGSIHALRIAGAINAHTGSGGITLEQVAPGNVDANTGSGHIEVRGVKGEFRASTGSGGIDVDGTPTGNWRIRSGSGSISMRLPSDLGFELSAHTSSGNVHSDHPVTVQGTIGRHELRGKVRGGGPLIEASTSSGSIRVQ
ncbi:MAG: DUF4097 family beta strand repeat protein [Acidobacteria bacterium]|nr:DUF4097 family beta strand repeat protein [Acidobacteriota bacterium]